MSEAWLTFWTGLMVIPGSPFETSQEKISGECETGDPATG